MYVVNKIAFKDLLDAVSYCKSRPNTNLTDSSGQVLMQHTKVSYETFRDIMLAKAVLKIQTAQ